MNAHNIYELAPDGLNYRHLVSEMGWNFETLFMYGGDIANPPNPVFRYLSLEEDISDELNVDEEDDRGQPIQSLRRFKAGVGDCTCADGFTTSLVFSEVARKLLAPQLESTGQLLPFSIKDDKYYIYKCTRLIDAVDSQLSEIHYHPHGRPSKFLTVAFRTEISESETLFRTKWPTPPDGIPNIDYAKIPPPLTIYATQEFRDKAISNGLTGFCFKPVGLHSE